MSKMLDRQPNIIFIHVDEMRFPMHFPKNIHNAGEFLANFMPNLHWLWKRGVKFTRYYTAAADCTPGRGTFVTGLYAYQTNLFLTRESANNPYDTKQPQPALQPEFPTYGKLLRDAGYDTPYIGKWHLSDCPETDKSQGADQYLNEYGFQGLTIPDPLGMPAQGLGLTKPEYAGAPPPPGDPEISTQAVRWLFERAKDRQNEKPFCLTVGFVNPHDKQFFWGGTQANQFNAVYNTIPDPLSPTGFEIPAFGFNQVVGPPPPPHLYDGPPDNWESSAQLRRTKPELQTVFKEMFAYYWTGGIAEDQRHRYFYAEPTPAAEHKHTAVAPYAYWARALDFYTQMMSAVDVHIGQVIHNIPEEFADNTVVVFSADHGEYASSHGLQGKGASVYEECFNVPLIVYDPQGGRFAKEPDRERHQLSSSVDLLRMLVTLGHRGSTDWLKTDSDYTAMYGDGIRADLYAILQSPDAPGRDYVIYSTDEFFSVTQDYHHAPQQVIGLLTSDRVGDLKPGKLGFYHHWLPGTTHWDEKKKREIEYYDYTTEGGRTEVENTAGSEEAKTAEKFLTVAIPEQLKRPLPATYQPAHERAVKEYWEFVKRADAQAIVSTAFA